MQLKTSQVSLLVASPLARGTALDGQQQQGQVARAIAGGLAGRGFVFLVIHARPWYLACFRSALIVKQRGG
jgi:hypothetical protein